MTQRAPRKTTKPYVLVMGGKLMGFFKTQDDALTKARLFNKHRVKSGAEGTEPLSVRITYDQAGEIQRTVYES
jgi:hypothetical protein